MKRFEGLCAFALFLSLSVVFACSKAPVEKGNAKILALSPAEHVGNRMTLEGKVASVGVGGAYFILEDESGKVLVSTHRVSSQLNCQTGERVQVVGMLERFERENKYFFSMEKLNECSP